MRAQNTAFWISIGFLLCLTGCERIELHSEADEVKQGGVTFAVQNHEVRRVELTRGNRVIQYQDPVYAIHVKLSNAGQDSFKYSPSHQTQRMTETSSPLLYPEPESEKDLRGAPKSPIPGVFLEAGRLDGQVRESKTLEPGESVEDIYLFEVPEFEKRNLIFSMPPSMHRGQKPVRFLLRYEKQEPPEPKLHDMEESIQVGASEFQVVEAEVQYAETEDAVQGEGFSDKPIFEVRYKMKNIGEEKTRYKPVHGQVSEGSGPRLLDGERNTYKRVSFPPTVSVDGQITKFRTVDPGEKIEDKALFELPGKSVEELVFVYPAVQFGESSLIRVKIPFEYSNPDPPEEIRDKLQ